MAQLKITVDKTAMSEAAAERVTSLVETAVAARGVAAISLTGGTTPDLLYQFLADPDRPWRRRIDWAHVHLFWSDEREVPPDHRESNFGLANRLLVQHVPVPETQIHRMHGELPASDAGPLYDALLRARRAQIAGPLFDVMLLGIGANAHIASIFPDSPLLIRGSEPSRFALRRSAEALAEAEGSAPHATDETVASGHGPFESDADLSGPRAPLAAGVHVPELSQWRITMTPSALLDSATIIVIANGSAKADAIAATLQDALDVARYPAQLLRAAGQHVEWIIDSAASARLRAVPPA
jgi:6-phosphogluconolactonase